MGKNIVKKPNNSFTELLIFLLIIVSCENPFTPETDECNECGISIFCNLPKDESGIYQMTYDTNRVMTYEMLFMETECGLSNHIRWDTNYRYRFGGQDLRLVNPSSMTDDEGIGRVMFGVWKDFIGYTIGVYGGYSDECENQHLDSIFIKIN
tara:strand:- start:161 stop:616 length:456 start_codon:yes stop_codon:yes gene_type:complete